MATEGRILQHDWDLYDTRHVVFRPARLDARALEEGYWRAYREFYRWSAIWRAGATKEEATGRLRHLAYAGGWKKFEPLWDVLIRSGQVLHALPVLEAILSGFGCIRPGGEEVRGLPRSGCDAGARRASPNKSDPDGPLR